MKEMETGVDIVSRPVVVVVVKVRRTPLLTPCLVSTHETRNTGILRKYNFPLLVRFGRLDRPRSKIDAQYKKVMGRGSHKLDWRTNATPYVDFACDDILSHDGAVAVTAPRWECEVMLAPTESRARALGSRLSPPENFGVHHPSQRKL